LDLNRPATGLQKLTTEK